MTDILIGRNTVLEALKNDRGIEYLLVLKSGEGSIRQIIAKARDKGIDVRFADRKTLDKKTNGANHQGVIAYSNEYEYASIEDIFAKAEKNGEDPFIIILDSIEDPHNLGAIIRSADGAGAHGIIIPKRRAAGVDSIVGKVSAGAVEYMPIVRVSNIAQTIDMLKSRGVWITALDAEGEMYTEKDHTGSIAAVVGNEGQGIGRLIKEKADFTVSIPMSGGVESLNASNAAAVFMYEVRRQRRDRNPQDKRSQEKDQ